MKLKKITTDYASIKRFLQLFSYADENKKKNETIEYIIDILKQAEMENKVLEFKKLEDESYSPNPLLTYKGELMFDTKSFLKMYNEYENRVKYVQTEVAKLVYQDYLILNDFIEKPLQNIGKEDSK